MPMPYTVIDATRDAGTIESLHDVFVVLILNLTACVATVPCRPSIMVLTMPMQLPIVVLSVRTAVNVPSCDTHGRPPLQGAQLPEGLCPNIDVKDSAHTAKTYMTCLVTITPCISQGAKVGETPISFHIKE